jgi:hypothetical protein
LKEIFTKSIPVSVRAAELASMFVRPEQLLRNNHLHPLVSGGGCLYIWGHSFSKFFKGKEIGQPRKVCPLTLEVRSNVKKTGKPVAGK